MPADDAPSHPRDNEALHAVFPGESEMAARMRAHDWSVTPLGPPETWPDALIVPLQILLTSRFQMWLGWGDDLLFFYNDGYAPTLGRKHPDALGRPVAQVWSEVRETVSARFAQVMHAGVATWDKALPLVLERHGYPEETYHTFSYSPLRGGDGAVQGLLCIVAEVTDEVINARRLELLHAVGTQLLGLRTAADLIEGVRGALAADPQDIPFGFLHLFDAPLDSAAPAEEQRLRTASWPYAKIARDGAIQRVALAGLIDTLPHSLDGRSVTEALLIPVRRAGAPTPVGCLVLGVNPLRPVDPEAEPFAQLISAQIGGVLATVDAHARDVAEMQKLQELFAQSPSFIAVLHGPDHRLEMVNAAYERLVGRRDLLGKPLREALPEVVEQGLIDILDTVYATGEPYVATGRPVRLQAHPAHPSEVRFLDFLYQPIRTNNEVTGVFVEGVDVTSAHDVAAALRDSEAQFKTLAEAIPTYLWTASLAGEITWLNGRALAYIGRAESEILGSPLSSLVHPDDLHLALPAWTRTQKTWEPYSAELRLRGGDGTYRWHLVRSLAVRDDDMQFIRWVGVATDIQEQKAAEAQTARALNRVWTLSPILKLVIDARTDAVVAANPSWTNTLGWSEAETLGRTFSSFLATRHDPTDDGEIQGLTGGLAVVDHEASLLAKTGERRIAWTTVLDEGLIYAFGRDVTELRLTEDALRQSQKMEAVGQLTGGIAHDFNNLLQGITGSLDLIQKRLKQGRLDDIERFIAGAVSSANRASSLTYRLLAFSRRQPIDPRSVGANPLVASMEDLLRRTLGESIALELVLAGGLWLTHCDANQLENAVLNLAINARDAMPDGGKLTIETCNAHLDSAYAAQSRYVRPGQYVCISVSDTGAGMSSETLRRAFDPFFTTKPIGRGTGLGLSMVYGFARQSEGYAKIYSHEGAGTTVKLYLPRRRGGGRLPNRPASPPPAAPAKHGETILVVEDEAVVRQLIVEVLGELGYAALEASDGDAGLAMLQSARRIDLLITDMGLPSLNGRQVADAGRMLWPDLKVLFMTGYAENAARAAGFLEPGMSMITKPFSMEVLATRIREIIEPR